MADRTPKNKWTVKTIILALALVLFGSINTLAAKWADQISSENSVGESAKFIHPFFQCDTMFVGEVLCMAVFYIVRCYTRCQQRGQVEMASESTAGVKFPKYILYIPAFCDMVATSTMYVGLTLTYASSFQMLRGAVIIFTGLFSVAFLGQRLRYFHWMGMVTVVAGLLVVGVSDFVVTPEDNMDTNGIITGDLLIITAQIITATQMVIEEKYVTKYNVPALLAVGWEGTFGFITLSILLVPLSFIPGGIFSGNPRGMLEDPWDAFVQMSNNYLLVLALLGTIVSIAFFNFAGISVTKELSATTRMVLDSIRTLVVWVVSLALAWQQYYYLQLIGFIVLIIGLFLYNDLIFLPFMRSRGWVNDSIGEPLQNEQTEEQPPSTSSPAEVTVTPSSKKDEIIEAL